MKTNNVLNASHWAKAVHQHYILYSPDPAINVYLKQQLIPSRTLRIQDLNLKDLHQPFACLLIDTLNDDYFLMRDHFGLEPFYYTLSSDGSNHLCWGSNLADILAVLPNPQQDEQQITNVLMNICTANLEYTDNTFYQQIYRVTPGHVLTLRVPQGIVHRDPFWTLTPGTPFIHYATDAEYDAHFAYLLEQAVTAACVAAPDSVAMEFSGGLDTSILLTALNATRTPAHLFMHVGENTEERRYGEQLLAALPYTYPIQYVDAEDFDVLSVLDQHKQWFGGGAPYLFFMFAANIHQAVQHQGAKILLSGFGGDEGVSSAAPLRTCGPMLGYQKLWQELQCNGGDQPLLKRVIHALLLRHPKLNYVVHYLKSCRSPLARKLALIQHKPYQSLQERDQDWLQGPLSHHLRMRIEYSAVVARYRGFTYQYPLLYPPLVEFCFALPPNQKRRQGQNRLLARRYLANHVPPHLFNTHKKCGDILPGTLPKGRTLYQNGGLDHAFQNLPWRNICDIIDQRRLLTDDRLFHRDLLRYMFKLS